VKLRKTSVTSSALVTIGFVVSIGVGFYLSRELFCDTGVGNVDQVITHVSTPAVGPYLSVTPGCLIDFVGC